MPIFEFGFSGLPTKPDGSPQLGARQVPIPQALQQCGPCIPVQISIAAKVAAALQKVGSAAPPPQNGLALIDTGATISGVDARAVQALGLQPIGVKKVFTARGAAQQPVYAATFAFPNTNIPAINFGELLGVDLADQRIQLIGNQPLIAVIGREILANFLLIYNGRMARFTLAF